jgi:flagellar hook-associated protein 1 FlgK
MDLTMLGLRTGVRGLAAAQEALDVVGQNITNANTEGYSRQAVNLVNTPAFRYPGANTPIGTGAIGSGVEVANIQRQRDVFLDNKINTETATLGQNEILRDGINQIQDQFGEPSANGLASVMTNYFSAWDQLSTNPESSAARSQVQQAGVALSQSFNSLYQGLTQIRTETDNKIQNAVTDANTFTSQIAGLNGLISQAEGLGLKANDLMDQRNLALQKLNKIVNVQSQIASDGKMLVSLQGRQLVGPAGAQALGTQPGSPTSTNTLESNLTDVTFNGQVMQPNAMGGQLGAYFQLRDQVIGRSDFNTLTTPAPAGLSAYGSAFPPPFGAPGTAAWNTPNGMLYKLDQLANSLSSQVNALHSAGSNLYGALNVPALRNFFTNPPTANLVSTTFVGAQYMSLNTGLVGTGAVALIAAGNGAGSGPGDNRKAQMIAAIRDVQTPIDPTLPPPASAPPVTTVSDYYRNFLSDLGVKGQTADRVAKNQTALIDHLNQQQQSVSGVNLDQEMTDMVKYQHAYNASAKVISMYDQLLDTIINMGGGH